MPRIIHFDVPADDPKRAQKFYQDVFDWKFDKWNGPMEYWMVKTGDDKQPGINGGLAKRMPGQSGITNTIDVPSVDEYVKKIQAMGGQVISPKMPFQVSVILHNARTQRETCLELFKWIKTQNRFSFLIKMPTHAIVNVYQKSSMRAG